MIRFIYKYVCAVLIATAALTACSDEVSLDDNWQPSLSPHQVEFSVSDLTPFEHSGGSQTLTITSTIDWTIVDKPDFVTITPAGGATGTTTVTVKVSPYDGIGLRSGDITFSNSSAKGFCRKVQVEQIDAIPRMTVVVGGVTFNMIKVEHGIFQMGSESGDKEEKPVHSVTISKDYYLGETEVTQALWKAVMGYSPNTFRGAGDNYPAYYISYEDVQEFITKLNQMTGQKFRMPTEAEWEFAAKGGTKSKGYTYSGSNNINDVAWYSGNSGGQTHPVKTKSPNELGIYDMSGNVWEWCADWYALYSSSAVTDPTGPAGGPPYYSYRIYRGGGKNNNTTFFRITVRRCKEPSYKYYNLGFRLAL